MIKKNTLSQKGKFIKKSKRGPFLRGIALLELALALVIIGVLMAAVLKSIGLLEEAKIQTIAEEVQRYRLMILRYRETYGYWPGEDPMAQSRFGEEGVQNGGGSGHVENGQEQQQFWVHLTKAGYYSGEGAPSSGLGGTYTIQWSAQGEFAGHWLVLGTVQENTQEGPVLTPHQARTLKSKVGEKDPKRGQLYITEGQGVEPGQCVNNGVLNEAVDKPTCIVKVKI